MATNREGGNSAMIIHDERNYLHWQSYYGPNLGYVQEQYENFLTDPESVEISLRELFARYGAPPMASPQEGVPAKSNSQQPSAANYSAMDTDMLNKVVSAHQLMPNIRRYGHLAADIDPL